MITNEQQIEDRIERMTDHLDRMFLRGAITEQQYSSSIADLNNWAEAKYKELYLKDTAQGVYA
jgi:hypothetical protein